MHLIICTTDICRVNAGPALDSSPAFTNKRTICESALVRLSRIDIALELIEGDVYRGHGDIEEILIDCVNIDLPHDIQYYIVLGALRGDNRV